LRISCARARDGVSRSASCARLGRRSGERSLIEKLGWRSRPNPVDLYAAVYEALEAMQAKGGSTQMEIRPNPEPDGEIVGSGNRPPASS